jgi:hypothetical protein
MVSGKTVSKTSGTEGKWGLRANCEGVMRCRSLFKKWGRTHISFNPEKVSAYPIPPHLPHLSTQ